MRRFRRSTRALMAGLFGTGLFYALLVALQGRWSNLDVLSAIAIEASLLIISLVRGPISKKGLFYILLAATGYFLLSVILGFFSEIAVMAAGGLGIYTFIASKPKFPLTKRAMVTGISVGVIMTFLGIYLALKIGVVYFIGAELLGAIILSMWGRYTPEENTIVVAIANSSGFISVGVLVVFPAVAIFVEDTVLVNQLITIPFIAVVTAMSAFFGIILLVPFRETFEDDPWPQVRPQAECIIALGSDPTSKTNVAMGIGASATWVATTKVVEQVSGSSLASVPNALEPVIPAAGAIPDWIGVANSPLLAGIGYFVGWKRTLVLLCGTLTTMMFWIILEGAAPIPYSDHLHRPEIIYLVLGVFASVIFKDILSSREREMTPAEFQRLAENHMNAESRVDTETRLIARPHKAEDIPKLLRVKEELLSVETLREEILEMVRSPREYMRSRRGKMPPWVAFTSMVLFMITGIIIFSILTPFAGVRLPWLLFVLGTPLAMVSAYFTARSISETGMLAGYISDVISIPAILFFRVSFQAITTFMAMLGGLQDAALALLVHLKLGRFTGVRGRDILKAVFIGMILGTIAGSIITYMLFRTYGFGGPDFPAPVAQLFGFLVTSIAVIGEFQLPGISDLPWLHPLAALVYLLSFGIVGAIAGLQLGKRGLSAISLAVGLLIPPATAVAMLFGAFIDFRMERIRDRDVASNEHISMCEQRREKQSQVLSGIVAGEAIVTVVWVMWSALTLFV
ncbi:MAG: OPT/YSL family transporter [Promethearchaeota archaeon]